MKTPAKILLLAAGLALAAVPFLRAADATGAARAGFLANHPRLARFLMQRQAVRQHVAQKLGLNADQIAQLKAERTKTVASLKAVRADTTLAPDQKKAQARETLQSARTAMRGVLTPDQLAQWDAMKEKFIQSRRSQN
jgi:hypothetical protein